MPQGNNNKSTDSSILGQINEENMVTMQKLLDERKFWEQRKVEEEKKLKETMDQLEEKKGLLEQKKQLRSMFDQDILELSNGLEELGKLGGLEGLGLGNLALLGGELKRSAGGAAGSGNNTSKARQNKYEQNKYESSDDDGEANENDYQELERQQDREVDRNSQRDAVQGSSPVKASCKDEEESSSSSSSEDNDNDTTSSSDDSSPDKFRGSKYRQINDSFNGMSNPKLIIGDTSRNLNFKINSNFNSDVHASIHIVTYFAMYFSNILVIVD
jgi:hypothetical protein